VARGAADNKGQHLANILGVLEARKAGKLAWDVKIILDGEEEVGSPNLGAIVQAHRDKLAADFMVGSDGPKSDNRPTLLLGVRGLLAVTVRCDNGTGRMLHSGNYGNVTPNPALPLARLLDEMAEAVKSVGEAPSRLFRQQIDQFFDPATLERSRYEPFLSPYFNVNSFMTEGATGGQRRTIIPSWAEASVDVRLIPGLSPEEVYKTLEVLTEKANAEAASKNLKFTIEMGSSCAASFTAPDREGFAWLRKVTENYWGDDIRLIPILGGTLPSDAFTEGLGMAAYWLPAANSNNRQHDTNEHLILEHYFRQQDFYARLVATPYE
jgi:acetylornithine deacetylase/succinyl-diaminopimelate desuccinylase-like protein